ncbi:MAG: DUF2336 domain-containing protein [Pseudomonadota bacterium]
MFVERFMAWSAQAGASQRSAAVCNLAQTYLNLDVAADDLQATEQVFTLYLQDPDMRVRATLAEALAPARDLPKAIIWGFLEDVSAVAASFYGLSPRLQAADLLYGLARQCPIIEAAIAARHDLNDACARLIVERGSKAGVLALLDNPAIILGSGLLHDCASRLGGEAEVRNALLRRDDLAPATRQTLVQGLSQALTLWAGNLGIDDRPSLAHASSDAVNRASIRIAEGAMEEDLADYANHLLETEQLTPGLLLRALVAGQFDLIEQSLAKLSGMSALRVRSILESGRKAAFRALLRRTGLPTSLYGVFAAGIEAWAQADEDMDGAGVLAAMLMAAENDGGTDGATHALLGRMAGEAHRDASQTYEQQLLLAAA